jgi:tetratricopeptide (TPR) repeat protein
VRLVHNAVALVVAGGLFAGAASTEAVRERRYPAPPIAEDVLYLTSAPLVSHLTEGFHALAADLYWIRAIQYYGGARRRLSGEQELGLLPPTALKADVSDYDALYSFLDLTTALDPRFTIAYRFGAIFLSEPYPGGPGRPDQAIELLEKGLKAQPDKWVYMEDIGFVYYWSRHEYDTAAKWFDRAADVSGAPWWLRSLAATTLAQGGDRQSSRMMWQSIRDSTDVDWLRGEAERRLEQLTALDQIDRLQPRVDAYARQTGTEPDGWIPMVRDRALPGIPTDPTGTPYSLRGGRVRVAQSSPLYPPPDEPAALPPPPAP